MPALAPDLDLRRSLLEYFLGVSTTQELSYWLRGLNQEPKGSVAEKRDRIRQNTKYLSMPVEEFPRQTENYLQPLRSEHLAEICEHIGIDSGGTKDQRYRRIMREVRFREGWFARPNTHQNTVWNIALVKPFIEVYPIVKRGEYERDFYNAFQEEMTEIFGVPHVHPQLSIAYGTSLKIDFHLGPAAETGVGVEMKMPTSNSELQRAIGQIDQYRDRYGSNLMLILLADFVTEAQKQLFFSAAKSRDVEVLER